MTEQFPREPLSGDANPEGETKPTRDEATTLRMQSIMPLAILCCVLVAILSLAAFVITGIVLSPSSNRITGAPVLLQAPDDVPPPAPSDPGDGLPVPTDPPVAADVAQHSKLRAAETQAIRSAKLQRFMGLRDETNEDLVNLATEMASWSKLKEALLDGDAGKHIASDEAFIERFLPVYQRELVTQTQYEAFHDRFVSLSQPINRAEQETTYLPSEDLFAELQALREEVAAALLPLTSTRKDAEAIQRYAASRPAAEQTLRTAIEEYRDKLQEDRLAQIASERKEAQQETTAQLAAAEAKREEMKRQNDLARIEKETAALADERRQIDTDSEAEAERRRAVREHAKLVREFEAEYPRFQSSLVVFTSKGAKQPVPFSPWQDTGKMEPVSLKAMKRAGLLDDSKDGRLWINRGAAALSGRDPGAFPNLSTGGPNASTRIREIQQFLLKYGDVMVEKGLLSP